MKAKKKIYYQIHKIHFSQMDNEFGRQYPFFKKGGKINGERAYFNKKVERFVMNDDSRKSTGHGGIYISKVPYNFILLDELIRYNNYIKENVSLKFKIKFLLNKIGFSFKTQNILKSKIEYFFGNLF